MRLALLRHRRDLAALIVLVFVGLGVLAYILLQQPAFKPPGWLRPADRNPYVFRARLASAPAIVAGQGQTVNIAGVSVGYVNGVELDGGDAVLTLAIRRKDAPVYRDATVLLRPRTALKDMYVALDPGTPAAGALPARGELSSAQTDPDVNFDEVLGNLDADTRAYLKLLLNAGGQALRDDPQTASGEGAPSAAAVSDLRGTYKQFEPLARDGRRLFTALAARRRALRRAIRDLGTVSTSVGDVNRDLAGLIGASSRTFTAFASQNADLRATLAELPGTLRETDRALVGLTGFASLTGRTLSGLRPFARRLGPSLAAARPFFDASVPVLRDQLRPFSRDVQPVIADLAPAATDVAAALPHLDATLKVVNRLFNALAYNPSGPEEGFLFWGAWLSHIGPSLLSTQDAHGAMPRAVALATCAQLDAVHQVEIGNPSLGPILRLLNLPDRTKYCPSTNPFTR